MNSNARGKHIFLDFTEFFPNVCFDGHAMLVLMKKAIENSEAREVHAHVEVCSMALSRHQALLQWF